MNHWPHQLQALRIVALLSLTIATALVVGIWI